MGEPIAKVLAALVPLAWAGIIGYALWLLRDALPEAARRLTGFEAFGVKLGMREASRAMSASVEFGAKHSDWNVDVPQGDRDKALARAERERALLVGAEILWVDDRPSNNRNESRMLQRLGANVTCAVTTEEALALLTLAQTQGRRIDLVLSDIARALPSEDKRAGLDMLQTLKAERFTQPVILYVGNVDPSLGVPPGAFGITNRPDMLLQLVLDALARVRGGEG